MTSRSVVLTGLIVTAIAFSPPKTFAEPLKLLFLGDNGPHRPAERFRQLQPVMKERGIELTYSDKVDDLSPDTLGKFDGLVIYANTTRISPEQEQALLDFVAGGKGFIPLHCASFCFQNSPKYIELVGAQFQRHGTGTFRTILAEGEHPILRGFSGFESWDETYVHTKHNEKDRTVLEYREEPSPQPSPSGRGSVREPWTWRSAPIRASCRRSQRRAYGRARLPPSLQLDSGLSRNSALLSQPQARRLPHR
jgi:type 1 glutamine amidotransferase